MIKDKVREFYETSLGEREFLILFINNSAVLVRSNGYVLLFDPSTYLDRAISELKRLNILFYTHEHYDHFNLDSTLKIYEATTCIVFAEPQVYDALEEYLPSRSLVKAKPGLKARIKDLRVRCIEGKHVGPIVLYYLKIGDVTLFHGADSAYVPLSGYKDTTIAFLPTGKPSPTASPENALKMAQDLNPKYVIAFHGSPSDHEKFKKLMEEKMPQVKLYIPNPGDIIKIRF